MTPERELAQLAILEPAHFEREVSRFKTQQEITEEQIAIFSISQPKAYSVEFEKFKTPERKQLEQQSRSVILNPNTHSGSLRKPEKNSPSRPQHSKP